MINNQLIAVNLEPNKVIRLTDVVAAYCPSNQFQAKLLVEPGAHVLLARVGNQQ